MIKLTETTQSDVEQIREWLAADPWHRDDSRNVPELMTTGNGMLSFCLQDDKGPLAYFKLTEEGQLARIAIQFAPEEVVSKRRLIVGLVKAGIPAMRMFASGNGFKGLVFESISPSLISFGERQGFKSVGSDDYALLFGDNTHV
jgi:hypothetical protein